MKKLDICFFPIHNCLICLVESIEGSRSLGRGAQIHVCWIGRVKSIEDSRSEGEVGYYSKFRTPKVGAKMA